jgi:DNA-binding response OmpR family regulator
MPSAPRVLIVDHDPLVANLLGRLLETDGYEVCACSSGEDALEGVRAHTPDAVILEVTLPGNDGLETCRRLRCLTDAVILLAGPRGETDAVVRGLRLGADDYLGKPYTYEVLASKLKAGLNLRSRQNRSRASLASGEAGLRMDPGYRRVFVRDGRCIPLTRKEFDLLQFLVENHDRVISTDDILARVWGPEYLGDRDLVKQFIHRLRSKLDSDPDQPRSIVTVRGSGYAFEPITRPSLKRLRDESRRLPSPSAARGMVPVPGAVPASASWKSVSPAGEARRTPARGPTVRAFRVLPSTMGALILVLGVAYCARVVAASASALPGDRLYPIKIGLEGIRYALALDEAEHPDIHLLFARERIEEVCALLEAGRLEGLSETLAAFESEMLAASWAVAHPGGVPPEEVVALRGSLEAEALHHNEILSALLTDAPEEARPGLEHALIVLNTGRGTAQALFISLDPEVALERPSLTPVVPEVLETLLTPPEEGALHPMGPTRPYPPLPTIR